MTSMVDEGASVKEGTDSETTTTSAKPPSPKRTRCGRPNSAPTRWQPDETAYEPKGKKNNKGKAAATKNNTNKNAKTTKKRQSQTKGESSDGIGSDDADSGIENTHLNDDVIDEIESKEKQKKRRSSVPKPKKLHFDEVEEMDVDVDADETNGENDREEEEDDDKDADGEFGGKGKKGAKPKEKAKAKYARKKKNKNEDDDDNGDEKPKKPRQKKEPKEKKPKKEPKEKKPRQPRKKKSEKEEGEEGEGGDGNDNGEKNAKGKQRKKRAPKNKSADDTEPPVEEPKPPIYPKEEVMKLAREFPDEYWPRNTPAIQKITPNLRLLATKLPQPGSIHKMTWSSDGEMLATCSSLGSVRVWDVDTWELITELKDSSETQIEEFYSVKFSPDSKLIFTCGKLKDRHSWSQEDEDNTCIPSPIKVFDLETGDVIAKLEGHTEEILCLKIVSFRKKPYLLSCSQDGFMIRWALSSDYRTVIEKKVIDDMTTNIVTCIAFVPNCGNKYYLAGCDDGIKVYDFEHTRLLQPWVDLYGAYCDSIKFIPPFDNTEPDHHLLISRGVELVCEDDVTKVQKENACHLRELVMPTSENGEFQLNTIKSYQHPEYVANTWVMSLATNRHYLLAPTAIGKIVVWNIRSGECVAVLYAHEDVEVRDILFHPTKRLLLTCGDDGNVRIFQEFDQGAVERAQQKIDEETSVAATTTTEPAETTSSSSTTRRSVSSPPQKRTGNGRSKR